MSWTWLKRFFRGFNITIRKGWPGEKDLPPAKVNYKPVTIEDIRKDFQKKKGGLYGDIQCDRKLVYGYY